MNKNKMWKGHEEFIREKGIESCWDRNVARAERLRDVGVEECDICSHH